MKRVHTRGLNKKCESCSENDAFVEVIKKVQRWRRSVVPVAADDNLALESNVGSSPAPLERGAEASSTLVLETNNAPEAMEPDVSASSAPAPVELDVAASSGPATIEPDVAASSEYVDVINSPSSTRESEFDMESSPASPEPYVDVVNWTSSSESDFDMKSSPTSPEPEVHIDHPTPSSEPSTTSVILPDSTTSADTGLEKRKKIRILVLELIR